MKDNFVRVGYLMFYLFVLAFIAWVVTERPFETNPLPGDIWSDDSEDPFAQASVIYILEVKDGYALYSYAEPTKINTSRYSHEFSFVKTQYDLLERNVKN